MSREPKTVRASAAERAAASHGLGAFETGEKPRLRKKRPRLPYAPGLDGLRALAVLAVLVYHAGLTWLPGGFLGVEVFFVLSGYLITALLLSEWREKGHVNLKRFWLRRARRLLPALYVLLAATLAFAVVFLPGEVARLRNDVLAALGYVTNWYLLAAHESYFEAAGRPSLLRHLWSLAVEEQFYLLWPPVFVLVAVTLGTRRWRAPLAVFAVAAASGLLMAILYGPGLDPSRVYYGTDTRATGLLVGAALAFAWTPAPAGRVPDGPRCRRASRPRRLARLWRTWRWTAPALLDSLGLAALGVLAWACLRLDESQAFLYRGGFALVALATAALVLVAVHPRARLGEKVLGLRPLRWIGERSYGIYLWHWPVFMVTRPGLDVNLDGPILLALRLATTLALADLSYRYVETPIRAGALGRAWKALREAQGPQRRRLGTAWAVSLGSVAAVSALLAVAAMRAEPPSAPSYLASLEPVHTKTPAQAAPSRGGEPAAATPAPADAAPGEASDATARPKGDDPEEAPGGTPAEPPPRSVTAIGDSVMLGAIGELDESVGGLAVVDAQVGMQAATAIEILRSRRAGGGLGEVVIVHLGNNGTFTADQFEEMMRVLEGHEVVLVNVKVPRLWEGPNNAVFSEGARRHPDDVTLVDWQSASLPRPDLFWDDGIHLRPEGARFYADLISARL